MITIGLTGSIGMGKSTTLRLFAEAGCATWDADAAVHRLYAPGGSGTKAVAALFPEAIGEGGSVDRAVLSRLVLSEPDELRRLEAAIHPLVAADRAAFLAAAVASGEAVAVLDVPLLFEIGGETAFDAVVVVTADAATRRARVLARPGMSDEKLDAILARQLPERERTRRADFVIETDEGIEAARDLVARILRTLAENSPVPDGQAEAE
ncbi:dephospho-CoA kinase [Parvularcula dongshanensis]|uniref:Dephospho-CoA kinase n=1 Tax=Parvularcula dongshanensis TaxID=1173995 RepID=A0A840I1U7_9PROT|nr:dephospho-CoA kinase [Parvularcula dongshanensis]MBB4658040.1 dephospho-CoA kinase [Parvularcula dongshanensis]